MKSIFGAVLYWLVLMPVVAQQPATKGELFFLEQQARLEQAYEPYEALVQSESWQHLMLSGKVVAAHQEAESLIPDSAKTALDDYILGNFYFTLDPEKSSTFMREAESKEPNNPLILFERAMQEHRNKNYNAAISYYERVDAFEFEGLNPKLYAYLTHALLMRGDAERALLTWPKADFGSFHISIEKAMYDLFSTSNQHAERAQIINALEGLESGAVCDLLSLDKEWEIDWWNVNPNEEHLAYDHELIQSLFRKRPEYEKEFAVCSLLNTDEADNLLKALETHFGDNALPDSPRAAYRILFELNSADLLAVPEILERYAESIKNLAERKSQNLKARELLGFLYSSLGDRRALEKLDHETANDFHTKKFAESYLLTPHLILFRPTYLIDAILFAEKYHDSPQIQALMMAFAEGSEYEKRYLTRFVAAQFPNVHVYSRYRLSDYVASLGYELNKRGLNDSQSQPQSQAGPESSSH